MAKAWARCCPEVQLQIWKGKEGIERKTRDALANLTEANSLRYVLVLSVAFDRHTSDGQGITTYFEASSSTDAST